MDARRLVETIPQIVADLRTYHGYRTLWLDLDGRLVHTEPDEELEREGFLYVGTFLRPGVEALAEALGRFVALSAACPRSRVAKPSPELGPARLVVA